MELKDYFKYIIDASERPMVLCDKDFRVIYINKKAERLYEPLLTHKLVGMSARAMLNEEELTRADAAVEWFKESTENNIVFVRHSVTDNTDIYIKAVRDDKGEVIGFYNYLDYRNAETGKEFDLN